jgi:hypothetical protein
MECNGRRTNTEYVLTNAEYVLTNTEYVLTNTELLHMVIQFIVYRPIDTESELSLVISKLEIPIRLHKVRANG